MDADGTLDFAGPACTLKDVPSLQIRLPLLAAKPCTFRLSGQGEKNKETMEKIRNKWIQIPVNFMSFPPCATDELPLTLLF